MLQCMKELDAAGARKLWAQVAPRMPQPASDDAALMMLHMARTQSPVVAFKLRAWSHRWLLDHGLPSQLPDALKPKAERLYPELAEAVGIACGGGGIFAPILPLMRDAMSDAVLECLADGHKASDAHIIKPRMLEAKRRTVQQHLGIR